MKSLTIGAACAVALFITGCQTSGGSRDAFDKGQTAQLRGDYTTTIRALRSSAYKGDADAPYTKEDQ